MREARALRRQCGRSRWPTLWPWRCTLGSPLRAREQLCVLCHPHGYSRWPPSCPWRCTQGSPPSAREQGRDLWRFSPAEVQSFQVGLVGLASEGAGGGSAEFAGGTRPSVQPPNFACLGNTRSNVSPSY